MEPPRLLAVSAVWFFALGGVMVLTGLVLPAVTQNGKTMVPKAAVDSSSALEDA